MRNARPLGSRFSFLASSASLSRRCSPPYLGLIVRRGHMRESSGRDIRPSGEILPRLASALAGRYTIEREIGRGGMATVYLARDLRHDRRIALKVLVPSLTNAIGAARFQREIQIAAALTHPHILT